MRASEDPLALANEIIATLEALMPQAFDPGDDHLVDRDPLLLAVLRAIAGPGVPHAPARPDIPLAQSALLVNGRGQRRRTEFREIAHAR